MRNSVNPDQTALLEQSDLCVHCLIRPTCQIIWGKNDMISTCLQLCLVFEQVNVSEQFQKKATYLGQKGLLFKRRVPCPLGDDADIGLCSLFEPDPEPEKIPEPTEVESVNGHAEMGQDGQAEMGQDGHAEMGQDGQAEAGQDGQTEVGQANPVTEGHTLVRGAVIGDQIAVEENMERSEAVNGQTEVGQAINGPATDDQQPDADENMDGSEEQIET